MSPKPRFNAKSAVSVIVPTIDTDSSLLRLALMSWLNNDPLEVLLVTNQDNLSSLQQLAESVRSEWSALGFGDPAIQVSAVPKASKRKQLAHGIIKSRGDIIVLVDDDIVWPSKLLPLVLGCFEDDQIGGVGTHHRTIPVGPTQESVWHFLASRRLARRNTHCMATSYLESAMTCLSGRTAAYRATILRNKLFLKRFTHDFWLGRYLLDSGDDTFITRWLLCNNWSITMQTDPEAEIASTSLPSARFLLKTIRWSRNSRRSFLRCVFTMPQLWW